MVIKACMSGWGWRNTLCSKEKIFREIVEHRMSNESWAEICFRFSFIWSGYSGTEIVM